MFRPVKIRQYIRSMGNRGFSAKSVLEGTDLDFEMIHSDRCLINFSQYRRIVSNMIHLTKNQAIGFEIGHETTLSDLEIIGHAMLSSQTIRQAMDLWIEYSNSLVGLLPRLSREETRPDCWALVVSETIPLGFIYNFCVEEALTMFTETGTGLSGEKPTLARLELSFPQPEHKELYYSYCDCPVQFNAERTRFLFKAPNLDKPISINDAEFNRFCLLHCSRIMKKIAGSPATLQLRSMFLKRGRKFPSRDQAARELGMSSQTLKRHLEKEGLTYRKLVNEFRYDLAREYLNASSMPVKEVAYLLGYQDVNAFRRAFKTWSGLTVQNYQNTSKQNRFHAESLTKTQTMSDSLPSHSDSQPSPHLQSVLDAIDDLQKSVSGLRHVCQRGLGSLNGQNANLLTSSLKNADRACRDALSTARSLLRS